MGTLSEGLYQASSVAGECVLAPLSSCVQLSNSLLPFEAESRKVIYGQEARRYSAAKRPLSSAVNEL